MQKKLIMTGRVSDPTGGHVGQLKLMLRMHSKPVNFFRFAARTEMEVATDSKGNFVFDELYPTEYSLAVSRDGVIMTFLESVNPQKQQHVKVRLQKTKMLRGRVVNGQNQPLGEADIRAAMLPSRPELHGIHLSSSRTDVNGEFQLSVLKTIPTLLRVEVSKGGYLSRIYQNVRITQEELTVVLEKGASIKGHVFMTPEVPLNGSYSVKLFPAGLQIDPVINPFLLRNPLVSKRFQAVVLKGRVLWADTGKPVVKALVSRSWYPWDLEPYDSSVRLNRFETETDENGSFEFTNLTQGRYLLEIRYAEASLENTSYKRQIIRKQIEIPACSDILPAAKAARVLTN